MILRRAVLVVCSAAVLYVGCSSPTPKKEEAKEPEKPPEPVSARFAFQQMYVTARGWAADAQGLSMSSIRLETVKEDTPGESGAWQAVFVSPSRNRAKRYTYSVVESAGNLHQGVYGNVEESWSGPRPTAQPWVIQAFKIDSTEAYQTAAKRSAEYMKKNPNTPITFLLEQTSRHPFLTWRVLWGESVGTSNYSVLVNASTGQYVETLR
jgi:hypothetical protein